MSEIRIEIPASLGLSDDDVNKLTEAFRSQVIGVVSGTPVTQASVRARPQIVSQSKLVPQTVGQVVEVR
jgi:hypothetical protein